jgi:rhodanese-related sulfurtransferase
MTPLMKIASIFLGLGIVIAFVPENTMKPYKLTTKEMLDEIQYQSEIISPDELANWIINKDPSIQLIDIRTPKEFNYFHLEEAINIPLNQLLNKEWIDYLNQGIKMNIYYSNGTTLSHEAWMITRQLGYENNYVLQGGLNYWTETILNPMQPTQLNADDEIAKYDFRKGASQYFGNGVGKSELNSNEIKSTKPKIKRKKKKKAPNGSC